MAQELIAYVKKHGLDKLKSGLAVSAKRHSEYNNLVLFKYSQLDSPMGNKVVQQSRGIILDEDNDWAVVSYPYDKFFNYGEGHAAELDWSTARVYEKLDGSLMTLYYYDGAWHVATSGTPDAFGNVMATEYTFKQLFWQVWDQLGYELPRDTGMCYMFELMTPYNRVVVRHQRNKIVLHGARRLSDLAEINPVAVAHDNDWECVQIHSLETWEDITGALHNLNPYESEGFVVAIAHIKDTMSTRRILEVIVANENDEFASYLDEYPEYTKIYVDIRARYERLLGEMEGFYEAVKDVDDRKSFALKVKHKKYSGALFGLKYGGVSSMREYLANMQIKNLEDWLDVKYVSL